MAAMYGTMLPLRTAKDRVSLCEALIRNPDGGAIVCAGNTGGGFVYAGHQFSTEVWSQMREGAQTFGDAVFGAKQAMAQGTAVNRGFLYSMNLLGDPATTIKLDFGSIVREAGPSAQTEVR